MKKTIHLLLLLQISLILCCGMDKPMDMYDKIQNTQKAIRKMEHNDDKNLPIVSVIVTFSSGGSYDPLFDKVKQKPAKGRVVIYKALLHKIGLIHKALKGEKILVRTDDDFDSTIKELISDINKVEPGSVLFNFECCSGSSESFPKKQATIEFIKYALDHSYMTMFSDFTVKSLIHDWDERLLGKNPFVNIGTCSGNINLAFNKTTLLSSPSAQLHMVAELARDEKVTLHAMGGTVVFNIDKTKIDVDRYDVSILTVVYEFSNVEKTNTLPLHTIGEQSGTVGHAVLKYKSGGIMLLSAGHWIELDLKIDLEDLTKVSQKIYGANNEYLVEIESIKSSLTLSDYDKTQKYQEIANRFVQQSSPSLYSNQQEEQIQEQQTQDQN